MPDVKIELLGRVRLFLPSEIKVLKYESGRAQELWQGLDG